MYLLLKTFHEGFVFSLHFIAFHDLKILRDAISLSFELTIYSSIALLNAFFVYSHSSGVQGIAVLVAMIFISDDVFFLLAAFNGQSENGKTDNYFNDSSPPILPPAVRQSLTGFKIHKTTTINLISL